MSSNTYHSEDKQLLRQLSTEAEPLILTEETLGQEELMFYKYVSGHIMVGLLIDKEIVFFYFLPKQTLIKSYNMSQLLPEIACIGSIEQIFKVFSEIQSEKYTLLQNNCISLQLQINGSARNYEFQLEARNKTHGHLSAELAGTQFIKQRALEKLHKVKEKLKATKKLVCMLFSAESNKTNEESSKVEQTDATWQKVLSQKTSWGYVYVNLNLKESMIKPKEDQKDSQQKINPI